MLNQDIFKSFRTACSALIVGFGAIFSTTTVAADTYPNRPVTLVVPYGPGGETDIFARTIAPELSKALGQSVVVLNRPGATGIVGSEFVARSQPDGYTLVFGTAATHALNVSVYKSLPYDPIEDFASVAFVGSTPLVLVAHNSMPSQAPDFIDLLKQKPGQYFYGAAGISTSYLGMELFLHAITANAVHVPYKGTADAIQDLIAGQVQFMASSIGVAQPLVQAGRLQAIAVAGPERLSIAPEIPTFKEAGGIDLDVGTWNVIMAPAGTPESIVQTLNDAVNKVMANPAVRENLVALGITPVADSSPASTTERIKAEVVSWGEAFKLTGVEPQ